MGAILHFSQTARKPRIQGLAESLGARRPPEQPVRRPALQFFAACEKCGLERLRKKAVYRKVPAGQATTQALTRWVAAAPCLYCNSLVTSCCKLLACASAEIPVWLRISYFDIFEVADA